MMGFLDMSNSELANYIARKYDSVDGHEHELKGQEKLDYGTAVAELVKRVGRDEAERLVDNA